MKIVLFTISLFLLFDVSAQTERNFVEETRILLKLMNGHHYKPYELEEGSLEKIKQKFLKNIDSGKIIFSKTQTDSLIKLTSCLDAYDNDNPHIFIEKTIEEYKKGLKKLISELDNYDSSFKFNYTKKEKIPYKYKDEIDFRKNDIERKEYLRKYIKLLSLYYLFENKGDTSVADLQTSTDIIIKNLKCKYSNLYSKEEEIENYFSETFLNTICSFYDPHTTYFSLSQMKMFESLVLKNSMSFGINLSYDNKGNIIVESLHPGGPAWNSNLINKDDVLIKIYNLQDSNEDICLTLESTYKIIYNPEVNSLNFKFRKKSGKTVNVILKKELLESEVNNISGYTLNGNKKIGYISLPGFYSDYSVNNGCASDVAKEIIKLKKDSIEGLILDLRNNGGGAVTEAIDLAGLFIDKGVICLFEDKYGEVKEYKDYKKGTVYDEPLLILVNEYSASASEIFAAAMQDYGKAIIAGSNTFGKATAQTVYPFSESSIIYYDEERLSGFIKITTNKIKRINSRSYQKEGIFPDVDIPSRIKLTSYFEKDLDHTIPEDSEIIENNIKKDSAILEEVAYFSSNRTADIQWEIDSLHGELLYVYDNLNEIAIDSASYFQRKNIIDEIINGFDKLFKIETPIFKALSNKYDNGIIKIDKIENIIFKKQIEGIENDYAINEAYRILTDFIKLKKDFKP